MAGETQILDRLAHLFRYPEAPTRGERRSLQEALAVEHPAAAQLLASTAEELDALTPEEEQELYVRTFDNNNDCALELGWHLYGENYNRGVCMVELRNWMARLGLEETSELPDHVTHVLPVVARMPEPEAGRWIRLSVLPALDTIFRALEERRSPHRHLLEATAVVLRRRIEEPVSQGARHE